MTRMTLCFLDVRRDGCASWIQYLCRPQGDRPDRPVPGRVGSIEWSLPVPFVRSQSRAMGALLDATCESVRAKRRYKNLVFSCEDTKDPAGHAANLEKARAAALQFRTLFAPNSDYALITHREKDHAHCHLVVSNWDKQKKVALAWDDNLVLHMQSFDWCTVPGVASGAYLYEERQSMAYPSGRKEEHLIALLEASNAEAADTIQAMVDAGGLIPYEFKGRPGVVFRGARIQLKAISFQLRRKGLKKGVALLDCKYVPADHVLPFHGPIEQQSRVYDRMGVGTRMKAEDYERFLFDPLFDAREMTENQRGALHDLQAGREPRDKTILTLLAKHIYAHQRRAIEYDGAERANDPQYIRVQYHRSKNKDMVRCPDGTRKSRDHILWDKQPYFVWDLSRQLARSNARHMSPFWKEFAAFSDWLDSMLRRPDQPNDQPL